MASKHLLTVQKASVRISLRVGLLMKDYVMSLGHNCRIFTLSLPTIYQTLQNANIHANRCNRNTPSADVLQAGLPPLLTITANLPFHGSYQNIINYTDL